MKTNQTSLVKALNHYVKEKNIEHEIQFFRDLSESVLWVPVNSSEDAEGPCAMATVTSDEGKKLIPVFLDRNFDLGEFKPEQMVHVPYYMLRCFIMDAPDEIEGLVMTTASENVIVDRNAIKAVDPRVIAAFFQTAASIQSGVKAAS